MRAPASRTTSDVYALLRDSPGAGYQGAEEESALRTVGNGLLTVVMFLLLGRRASCSCSAG